MGFSMYQNWLASNKIKLTVGSDQKPIDVWLSLRDFEFKEDTEYRLVKKIIELGTPSDNRSVAGNSVNDLLSALEANEIQRIDLVKRLDAAVKAEQERNEKIAKYLETK